MLSAHLPSLGMAYTWLNIQKTKIMASSPIDSLQIDGETMETMTDFIILGFKITADGDCNHGIIIIFFTYCIYLL